MPYTSIQVPFRKVRFRIPTDKSATSMMVNPTLDLKDLPQLMSPAQALTITNYNPTADAQLPKRKGLKKIFTVAGNHPVTLLQQFTPDIWIFGYDVVTAAYTISTNTVTTIKNNWPTNDPQSGARYGDFFFVCNGSDVIHRIDTGLVITAVAGSPHAKILKAISGRLFAGNLSTDKTAVAYSKLDDGTNPPFTVWAPGTGANDPGLVSYRNEGDLKAIDSLGVNIIILAEKGKWSFSITSLDVGGILTKDDQFGLQRIDMGGSRATAVTPKALIYVNAGGLWQLASVGQSNVPFSQQEAKASLILGASYFDNIDLTNADMAYDARVDTLYLTCARNSVENNLVIAYNFTSQAYAEFTGWNINRFMNINQVIFGAGSVTTTVWQCFSGYDDDGKDIWTTFYQELKLGELDTRQILMKGYVDAFLSPSTVLQVCFDIYDTTGNFIANKLCFVFSSQAAAGRAGGWGVSAWGGSGFGGHDSDAGNNMVECFDGFGAGHIRNFQRVRIKITGHDKIPHSLVWIKAQSEPKIQIRRRKMKLLT